jgi:hypothetical protein
MGSKYKSGSKLNINKGMVKENYSLQEYTLYLHHFLCFFLKNL